MQHDQLKRRPPFDALQVSDTRVAKVEPNRDSVSSPYRPGAALHLHLCRAWIERLDLLGGEGVPLAEIRVRRGHAEAFASRRARLLCAQQNHRRSCKKVQPSVALTGGHGSSTLLSPSGRWREMRWYGWSTWQYWLPGMRPVVPMSIVVSPG